MSQKDRNARRLEQSKAKGKGPGPDVRAKAVAEGNRRLSDMLATMPLSPEEKLEAAKVAACGLAGWEAYKAAQASLIERYGDMAMVPFLVEVLEQGRAQALAKCLDTAPMAWAWQGLVDGAKLGLDVTKLRRPTGPEGPPTEG